MFVRTKDNRIIEVEDKLYNYNGKMKYQYKDSPALLGDDVIKASENLEELIKGGDLIIVSDSNDNKLPMIYEKYYFDCWCKTHDNLISKMEWYIKYGNDYKLVATKQYQGEWELYKGRIRFS
jgi:hypothetical protein